MFSTRFPAAGSKVVAADKSTPGGGAVGTQDGGENFQVGERVWVNGNKPGVVQFLGEAQFAPGQWAGIVLDEPIGKNDGSVAGVRYFQCEALKGIFTRPSKLSYTEGEANGTQTAPPSRAGSPTPSTASLASHTPSVKKSLNCNACHVSHSSLQPGTHKQRVHLQPLRHQLGQEGGEGAEEWRPRFGKA